MKNFKFLSLIAMALLTLGLLAGCGQDTKDVTVTDNDNEQKAEKEKAGSSEETKKEEGPKIGSRSNPIPFQSTATVDDEMYDDKGEAYPIKFDLTVVEVVRGEDAYQLLLGMNQFNEAAPEGYEWVLAKTKVSFKESATEDLAFFIDGIMNFEMVSESGDIYSGDVYATTDPDFSFEMYVGSEKEGYIGGLVKAGEKAQLRYEQLLDGQVFFNLE
jgi:hypothetical protein